MNQATAPNDYADIHNRSDEALVDLSGMDMSFWQAKIWVLPHSNPAKRTMRIYWCFNLPRGGRSTDAKHFDLLDSFKTVVWGLLTNQAAGKRSSVGSAGIIGVGVRELFRWLSWRGLRDFSQFTRQHQSQYLNDLPNLVLSRHDFYPDFVPEGYDFGYHSPTNEPVDQQDIEECSVDFEGNDFEDDGITYNHISTRLNTVYFVYAQRRSLIQRGLKPLQDVPFEGKKVGELTTKIARYVVNRIPALPRDVGLPLLTQVLHWVEKVGPALLEASAAYHQARGTVNGDFSKVSELLESVGLGESNFRNLPWRERCEDDRDVHLEPVKLVHHHMRVAVLSYRDACVLALQYLAGLRISEVCSPVVAKEKVGGLASCLYKRISPDGMLDLYFLSGHITKGRGEPKPNDWVIGCAPCGSGTVPLLVRAINQLHDLFSPLYPTRDTWPLYTHFSNPVCMPVNPANCVQADGIALLRGCRRFIRCFVDLSKLPDFDDLGNSLIVYRDSKGQCIRTHQGRKTFAEYCLKSRKSALSALSFHYGHLTEAVTYAGYFSPVQRLVDDLETMAYSATVDFFVSRAEGKVVFGNMAKAVNTFFSDFGLESADDLVSLRDKVEGIVRAHDIRIFFGDYGNCFISALPMESRCQQADGGASWMLRRPSYVARSVSMCAGCNCFLLDRTHQEYWERRTEAWKAAAQDPTNRVAVRVFQQSRSVLRYFESPDENA